MNKRWNELIQQQFSDPDSTASDADCALSPLNDMGLIRVTGADAREFLQGQLTCDINEVTPQQARLGAYCTPKGRALALFLAFEHAEALYLHLPAERLDAILKRLSMFVLRSDVTLVDASEDLVCLGLTGNCVNELVKEIPSDGLSVGQHGESTVIRMPGNAPRVMIIADFNSSKEWLAQKADQVTLASEDFWHLMDIRAGIPAVYEATAEAFVPQMINLQQLDGISFTKGCYTGQEVVARMKYLGQLKRRMYLARFESAVAPAIGSELHSASSKSGQGAGKIVDVRPAESGYEALVVSQISSVEADDLHLGDASGPRLKLSEPPYGFPDE